jgi:hypothetical protein
MVPSMSAMDASRNAPRRKGEVVRRMPRIILLMGSL